MTETTKRSLLDELRAKADAVRARDALDRLPAAEARQEINACLWRTFRWLEEALGHLEVIRPPIARTFRISNLLSLEGPRFESGFASFRRSGLSTQDELEHVQIFYQLAGREPIVLRVHPSAVIGVDERLRGATLP